MKGIISTLILCIGGIFISQHVQSQEEHPIDSTFSVKELTRNVNYDKGIFSVELAATYKGGYISEYYWEQDSVRTGIVHVIIPGVETAYIYCSNLSIDKTTVVYMSTFDKNGISDSTYTYTIAPLTPADIASKTGNAIKIDRYEVFFIDGQYAGTFKSYDKIQSSNLPRSLYIVRELSASNKIIRTKKYLLR